MGGGGVGILEFKKVWDLRVIYQAPNSNNQRRIQDTFNIKDGALCENNFILDVWQGSEYATENQMLLLFMLKSKILRERVHHGQYCTLPEQSDCRYFLPQ